jgi:hypothetical protein
MAPPTSMPANGGQLVFEPSETLVFDLTTDKTAPTILTARNACKYSGFRFIWKGCCRDTRTVLPRCMGI